MIGVLPRWKSREREASIGRNSARIKHAEAAAHTRIVRNGVLGGSRIVPADREPREDNRPDRLKIW